MPSFAVLLALYILFWHVNVWDNDHVKLGLIDAEWQRYERTVKRGRHVYTLNHRHRRLCGMSMLVSLENVHDYSSLSSDSSLFPWKACVRVHVCVWLWLSRPKDQDSQATSENPLGAFPWQARHLFFLACVCLFRRIKAYVSNYRCLLLFKSQTVWCVIPLVSCGWQT